MSDRNNMSHIDICVVVDRVKTVFSIASLIRARSIHSSILERYPLTRKRM